MDPKDALRCSATLELYEALGRQGSRPPPGLRFATGAALARELGYPDADLATMPPEVLDAFVGAGAVAPEVAAGCPPRDAGWVLDLGCGAGLDSLLLSRRGYRVVSLDGAPSMLRRLAGAGGGAAHPVRAVLPDLPVATGAAGWVLLNGVANLVAERRRFLAELARVLRPEGQLLLADLVVLEELPDEVRDLPEAWAWCVGGASTPRRWRADLEEAGFEGIEVRLLEEIPPLARGFVRARKHGEGTSSRPTVW